MRLVFMLAQTYPINDWKIEDNKDEGFNVFDEKMKILVADFFLLLEKI